MRGGEYGRLEGATPEMLRLMYKSSYLLIFGVGREIPAGKFKKER